MNIPSLIADWQARGKTHVVFDFDKTIGTLLIDWREWDRGMRAIVQPFDPSYDPQGGSVKADNLNSFIRRFGSAVRDSAVKLNREIEVDHCSGLTPNVDCITLVFSLREAGLDLAIWSSNDTLTLDKHLTDLGIKGLFSTIVGRDDVTYTKPDPDGWRLVNPTNIPVERFVFIGDSVSDSGACEALGMDFVHVSEISS